MPKKPTRGDFCCITFLDHVEDHDEPIAFQVVGRVIKDRPESITLGCWLYADEFNTDENTRTYCIVKSAIVSVKHLK